jgi:phosphomannomutase
VQKEVLKKQCALGISFDGDGDRVGFVDEKGEVVGGDLITALLAQGLEEKGSAVIYDLRSSRVVREEIERLGMRPVESRVGHTFLKANMRKENAVMGGEVSGHYYFRDFFFADSAIFATLSVLDMLCRENEKFSEIVKPLRKYAHSGEINFDVSDKDKILDRVVAHFADAKISYLDGIKVEYWDSANLKESWWFSLRPSNTENLLRLNLEASSPELLAQKKKLLEELLTT